MSEADVLTAVSIVTIILAVCGLAYSGSIAVERRRHRAPRRREMRGELHDG